MSSFEIWQIIVGIATAIGTIALSVMAYKSIREEREFKNREFHSKELREYMKSLIQKIPSIQSSHAIAFEESSKIDYDFENEDFFIDITAIHFKDLGNKFKEYKKKVNKYLEKRNELLNLVKKEVNKKTNISPTTFENIGIYEGYITAIYSNLIYLLKWKKLQHEIYDKREKPYLKIGNITIAKGDEGKLEELEKIHGEMSRDTTKFKDKVENIINMEKELNQIRNKIINMCEEFTHYSTINGNCKYLKRSYK